MELCTMKELLQDAYRNGYAVPAFNVCNLENIQGILEAAEECRAPVIIQAHWLEAYYSSPETVVSIVKAEGERRRVRAAIHLDHGAAYEDTVKCVRGGFTSVMYDGSQLPLEENIANLRKVCEMARAVGVTVEGEIGTIGQNSEIGDVLERVYMTDPMEAKRLADETQIDCLAVAIGNAHGFYTSAPQLDFKRLSAITELVKIPIVLHGGTGIPCDQLQKAIGMGVSKVNFSSVLRKAFIKNMYSYMEHNPDEISLMDIMNSGKEAMKEIVRDCIDMCMCRDRY
ncbi:class II fructose-bisphosphate aldolase family protein [Blautia schinkii]|nr:class II fructose-bisphosphate aldolase family protein [Blautia schinkii]